MSSSTHRHEWVVCQHLQSATIPFRERVLCEHSCCHIVNARHSSKMQHPREGGGKKEARCLETHPAAYMAFGLRTCGSIAPSVSSHSDSISPTKPTCEEQHVMPFCDPICSRACYEASSCSVNATATCLDAMPVHQVCCQGVAEGLACKHTQKVLGYCRLQQGLAHVSGQLALYKRLFGPHVSWHQARCSSATGTCTRRSALSSALPQNPGRGCPRTPQSHRSC